MEKQERSGPTPGPKSSQPPKRPQPLKRLQQYSPAIGNVYIFFAVLSIVGVLSFALLKPTESVVEKRELTKKPAFTFAGYFDGSFSVQADAYYADTFPLREFFVLLGSTLAESRGLRIDDVRIHEAAPPPPVEPQPSPGEEGQTPGEVPPVEDDGTQGEQIGSYFIYKGQGLSMFGGNEAMAGWYASTVGRYAQDLPGVQVYNLVIPTHIEFALPERYRSITAPQKPNIDYIYSHLNETVKAVDAHTAIGQHADEYLYFNTDHHWTARGAYYAYTAFAKEAGFEPVPLEDFAFKRLNNFLGTIYSESMDSKLREKGDFVEYPVITTPHTVHLYKRGQPNTPYQTTLMAEYASGVNSYSVFLSGDLPLTTIRTGLQNGRKIAVVKESFGNAFVPYLVNHYEEIYVVDQRYFEKPLIPFIQSQGIGELLFINNIFAANTAYHIRCIETLMYTGHRPPEPPPPVSSEPEDPETEEPETDPEAELPTGPAEPQEPVEAEPGEQEEAAPDEEPEEEPGYEDWDD